MQLEQPINIDKDRPREGKLTCPLCGKPSQNAAVCAGCKEKFAPPESSPKSSSDNK